MRKWILSAVWEQACRWWSCTVVYEVLGSSERAVTVGAFMCTLIEQKKRHTVWKRHVSYSQYPLISGLECNCCFLDSYLHSPGSATPDTGHRGRRWRRPTSPRSAVYWHTTYTPWNGWCSWHSWFAGHMGFYRDGQLDSEHSLKNGAQNTGK